MNTVDKDKDINKYGSIFRIDYDYEFEKFNYSDKNLNDKNLNVYHLECLEILSLENWNKCFLLDKRRKIIDINYPYFGEICCDLQKSLKGTLNFTAHSFTSEPLIPGDLETYYFQYIKIYYLFLTSQILIYYLLLYYIFPILMFERICLNFLLYLKL